MRPLEGQLSLFDVQDDAPAAVARAPRGDLADLWAAHYRGALWRAYSADSKEDDIRRCFRARFGVEPATVTRGLGNIWLAGPIPAAEVKR